MIAELAIGLINICVSEQGQVSLMNSQNHSKYYPFIDFVCDKMKASTG
jgi:hypothetical protein